ncbi:MAG: aminodeoxychorismate synthase component I [Ignavibacteriaceae bacterium]
MELKEILNTVISTDYSAFFYTPIYYNQASSYLFVDPVEVINIKSKRNLEKKLKEIDQLIRDGYSAYSIIQYEAGYLFEKRLHPFLDYKENLIQFFFCNKQDVIKYKSTSLIITENKISNYSIKDFRLNNTKQKFKQNLKRIKKYIEQGDTYQVNYTVKGNYNFQGDIANLFINLLYNQSAKYSALINNKDEFILSISPELFFSLDGRKIIARPMKGTSRRGNEIQNDNMIKHNLSINEKNRAENVMIVDLLRNDLGRISEFGSVKVNKLFEVEKYESLYQMTSEISSKLKKQITVSSILKNIYPCGSITGAPKIRTMEIIRELEKEKRGLYTGSIGMVHKKKIEFNVAIRTLVINKKSLKGEIGLGSGIVWDSNPNEEFKETVLKSRFLTHTENEFKLFETMLLEKGHIVFLEDHLKRLSSAASFFLFRYDENKIVRKISNEISKQKNKNSQRVKISLNKWGKLEIEITPLVNLPEEIKVIISKNRIHTYNKYQHFKTTNRILYNREHKYYSKRGFYEVLYFNEKNELAEGSITNIFLKINDTYFTPPASVGILAGVYRNFMSRRDTGIKERTLYYEDLMEADEIILTNALRGEVKVHRLYLNESEYKIFN